MNVRIFVLVLPYIVLGSVAHVAAWVVGLICIGFGTLCKGCAAITAWCDRCVKEIIVANV